jgi:hypothetical protein
MKPARTRLYIIDAKSSGAVRLVSASSHHAAISHAAGTEFTYRVATAEEAFALGQGGVKIEVAGAADQSPAVDPNQTSLDV